MKENVTVPAVERALNVLEYFALNNDEKSLKAIGDDLAIPSASLFRIIKNLVSRGYLLQVENNPPKYVMCYKINRCIRQHLLNIYDLLSSLNCKLRCLVCPLRKLFHIGFYDICNGVVI